MYTIKRKESEIDTVLNEAMEHINAGITKFHAMSFEEGLREMFDWLTTDDPEPSPME